MINKPLLVIALGGNALLKRGEALDAENQLHNVKIAMREVAKVADQYRLLIVHGNGPQVGLLALQQDAYHDVAPYPLDILDAETQGMIGYLLQQQLHNFLPQSQITTLITQVIVDKHDPALKNPSKPIGPVYNQATADQLTSSQHWQFKPDGEFFRRVVPSPAPQEVVELDVIRLLLEHNVITIAGGGGGMPCVRVGNHLQGLAAVIDKDATASLLAQKLNAHAFVILTDVAGVYQEWPSTTPQLLHAVTVAEMRQRQFAPGSMQPKINAVCDFVSATHKPAAIGRLDELAMILSNDSGTWINH